MTKRVRTFPIAVALVLFAAVPAAADPPLKCGTGQTLVSIDQRECPATPPAPAVVVQRVCCKNPAGHVQCRPFPHCRPVSPS